MGYETILLQKEKGVATVTLNRPDKLNALNYQMILDFLSVFGEIKEDRAVRAVIVTGAGRGFCAGGDLSSPIFDTTGFSGDMRDFFQKVQSIPLSLRTLRKPVISAVNGPAMGAGCAIAIAADIIIASEAARFAQSFVNVGYHPDAGATYLLPRLVGTAKACELIFTGRTIDAREAERIVLVNQVVPPDQLMPTVRELALKLASGPSVAIGLAKGCIYNELNMTLEQALDYEAEAACLTLQTEDQKEGTQAFREKRQANYQGK